MAELKHVRRIMASLWGERVGTIIPIDSRQESFAFKYYRKQWIEANIGWMVAIVVIIIVAAIVLKTIKKIKRELETL